MVLLKSFRSEHSIAENMLAALQTISASYLIFFLLLSHCTVPASFHLGLCVSMECVISFSPPHRGTTERNNKQTRLFFLCRDMKLETLKPFFKRAGDSRDCSLDLQFQHCLFHFLGAPKLTGFIR